MRTCVGCRNAGPASTLSRFIADGHSLAIGTRKSGRGAWLCTATMLACFDQATSQRSWARALRTKVDAASIERLRAHLAEPGVHG